MVSAALTLGGLTYPFLVLIGLRYLPPWALLLLPVVLLFARLSLGRRGPSELVLGAAALLVCVMNWFNPELAVRAWPVLVSLGMATLFTASFRWGPVMIQRIAEAADGPLPVQARPYLRRLTAVWIAFFMLNAVVSGWTVLFGTLEQWALYNGLLSYLLVGALIGGEVLVRHFVRPRQPI